MGLRIRQDNEPGFGLFMHRSHLFSFVDYHDTQSLMNYINKPEIFSFFVPWKTIAVGSDLTGLKNKKIFSDLLEVPFE